MMPEWFLQRRRQLGDDRFDEVWDGVVHMNRPPMYEHQSIGSDLIPVLAPLVDARDWHFVYGLNLYNPEAGDRDYRRPDLVMVDPAYASERGVEGRAELAIEILSPDDESRAKLPFYAHHGVQEVWLIEPKTRVVEIYTLRGGSYFAVAADTGIVRSPLLETIDGPKLRVHDGIV